MSTMTQRKKLTFAAGAAGIALLVAGLGAAGAVAASRMLSPSEESKAVIDDAAAQLGVEPSALSDALKQAFENRIDEAVAAGRLTKEQADELEKRIDSHEFPLLFGGGRGGPGRPGFGHHGHGEILAAAASYLGLTDAELREALENKTLAKVAKEQGKTVSGLVQAIVTAQETRIDEAVADGRLTQEQATEFKAGLAERTEALVNGELHGPGDGRHPGFWPGFGSPRAPPPFGGPPA